MYVELHCHSAFSFLDGASLPDELVPAALELGYEALASADMDGLQQNRWLFDECRYPANRL